MYVGDVVLFFIAGKKREYNLGVIRKVMEHIVSIEDITHEWYMVYIRNCVVLHRGNAA